MTCGNPVTCDDPNEVYVELAITQRESAALAETFGRVWRDRLALVGSANQGRHTDHLSVADVDGNMVACTTTLQLLLGSAVTVPGTGILLNNRVGRGFSTDPAHPNALAPGKRTMHTLHCYMVFRGDTPYLVGGTPGGDGQPQWNLQVLTNLLDWQLNVQQAVEAPRWMSHPGTDPVALGTPYELRLESGFAPETWADLERRGHRLRLQNEFEASGCQLILVDAASGAYHGGSDPRADGCAIGY